MTVEQQNYVNVFAINERNNTIFIQKNCCMLMKQNIVNTKKKKKCL